MTLLPPPLQAAARRFNAEMERVRAAASPEGMRPTVHRAIGDLLECATALESREAPDAVRAAQRALREELGPTLAESWIIHRSVTKPLGYAGDHLLIDAFYTRRISGRGVGRLLDEAVLDCAAGRAVVARKRYVATWIGERLRRSPGATVVDVACGPCRLERDVIDAGLAAGARFVAMDGDGEALAYARAVLGADAPVTLWHENAIRVARDPRAAAPMAGADLVVSLGLFDYLPDRIAARLLRAIRVLARPGAEILVGNFASDNPSRAFMEWFGDWALIHRSEREFLAIFEQAGFDPSELRVEREEAGGSILLVTARVAEERRRAISGPPTAAAAA